MSVITWCTQTRLCLELNSWSRLCPVDLRLPMSDHLFQPRRIGVRVKQRIRSPFFERVLRITSRRGGCYTLAERYGERIRCFTPAHRIGANFKNTCYACFSFFPLHSLASLIFSFHAHFCYLQNDQAYP
jgi:hypothetical protein